MNRVAMGAACAVAFLFSIQAIHMRRALGTFALEQVERVFDTLESVLHRAAQRTARQRRLFERGLKSET